MKLSEILQDVEVVRHFGARDVEIGSLTFDSRSVKAGSLFFAVKGVASDGHDYIPTAVAKGAVAVVCEQLPETLKDSVAYVQVADSHRAMGLTASAFYGHPSHRLRLVGVTGTNGKTTTATLLYELFGALGHKSGLISTVEYCIGEDVVPSTHTTPDPIRLNAMIARMVERGCEYCFMEVSSHSIVQQRTSGLRFAGGAFTNLTHDHLDYHGTFADYIAAKKRFFDELPREAFALTNRDDRNGLVVVQNTRAAVRTLSLRGMADFRCRIVETHFEGMLLSLDGTELWTRFIGRFNAYNLVTVYGCALLLGADRGEVLRVLSSLGAVRGRFETVSCPKRGITAIVDYAHTPDALQNVLETIAEIRTPEQRIFTVVGCGGDRDATKRPEMARIAAQNSDVTIFTSDNPRSEDPLAILAQMKTGLEAGDKAITIPNRREAIDTAATLATEGDIILIAGKGHETYQIIGGETHHFDDREEIRRAFGLNEII
ncbi:MAG: UDP-N-acetylmuramoyl-L-alanyl-D-glutamate--2,6-diaminopimelate ligase [Rikenellaceae bacterium]|jgi:UDP-N-acetylmuramoyl-L-alanyl-D-glutamate--2,6-diaminopimelate ligase|nr:UDP-N-acetylmuramoyl-L-alanyl-D-glutamate--2,6-diaminopimelate ligase [Rikenellaceae bacterium]